ncbi:MAG: hypothetical protein ACREIU_11745, partial [Planctomycetota bacterium]
GCSPFVGGAPVTTRSLSLPRFLRDAALLCSPLVFAAGSRGQCVVVHVSGFHGMCGSHLISCSVPPDVCPPASGAVTVDLDEACPSTLYLLVIGSTHIPPVAMPSPPMCVPVAFLFFVPDVLIPVVTNASGQASFTTTVPCAALGVTVDVQWWGGVPCLVASDALHVTFF